jgi:hypothetical protein
MTSVSSRPVARLSSPGDIVATVPALCGFQPADSVVVLSLRGPRRRLGLTVRLDLPPPALAADAAASLAARVVQDGGTAAVVVVYGDVPDPALVDELVGAGEAQGVRVVEALHVADGAWTSYRCTGPCCPPTGTPVGAAPPLVQAEHALEGRAVLGSRQELVRSLAPPATQGEEVAAARAAWAAAVDRKGTRAVRRAGLLRADALVAHVAGGGTVSAAAAAELSVLLLEDVAARDEVATWGLERADAVLALTEQVARLVGPPFDAPVCSVLAWVAYARGDGARANVALDRALRADPSYSLALLLRAALDGALPPAEVRRTMQATAAALRARR